MNVVENLVQEIIIGMPENVKEFLNEQSVKLDQPLSLLQRDYAIVEIFRQQKKKLNAIRIDVHFKRISDLITEVLKGLPRSVYEFLNFRIASISDERLFQLRPKFKSRITPDHIGMTFHEGISLDGDGLYFIYLSNEKLLDMSDNDVKAIIAHEIAHVYKGHCKGIPEQITEKQHIINDIEAEKQAAKWGFKSSEFEIRINDYLDQLNKINKL